MHWLLPQIEFTFRFCGCCKQGFPIDDSQFFVKSKFLSPISLQTCKMAFETDLQDVTIRRRNIDSSSPVDYLKNEQHSDSDHSVADSTEEKFDEEFTTLDTKTKADLVNTTCALSHDDALHKLKEVGSKTPILPSQIGTDFSYKREIVWKNALGFLALHICALIGVLLVMVGLTDIRTVLYCE